MNKYVQNPFGGRPATDHLQHKAIDVLFFDVENSRVFWFYSIHGRNYTGSMGQCNNGSGTVTKNGSSVTIAFSGIGGYFSQWDMWNEHVMYGSYEYYIYG